MTECKDDYPAYCKLRVSKFTKVKACNEQGKKLCAKTCEVCSKLFDIFKFLIDLVVRQRYFNKGLYIKNNLDAKKPLVQTLITLFFPR